MTQISEPDQIFLRKLGDIVLANLGNEAFGVKELALESGMSLYRLGRRLHSINKKTINQFIREIRLQKAMEMLQYDQYTAAEIAYQVGFGSPTYFTKSFHKFFGYPPGEVKKRVSDNHGINIHNQSAPEIKQMAFTLRSFIFSIPGIVLISGLILAIAVPVSLKILDNEKFANAKSNDRRISLAILPFQNRTNDTVLNIWQSGIQQNLISSLSNVADLQIRQKEAVNEIVRSANFTKYASITPYIAGIISQKLDADIIISGNIQKEGSIYRISAQLTDTKTGEVLKSISIEKPEGKEDFFQTSDTLSERIRDYLLISEMISDNPMYQHIQQGFKSPDLLRCVMYGDEERLKGFNSTARTWYLKALNIDSNSIDASLGLYFVGNTKEESLRTLLRLYSKKDKMSIVDQLFMSWAYAVNFEPCGKVVEYLNQLGELDKQNPAVSWHLGTEYNKMHLYDKAITELEKSFVMRRELEGIFMKNELVYGELGYAYHKTGQYRKEKRLYKYSEKYIPDNRVVISRQAILAFDEKDTIMANRYIEKYIRTCREKYSDNDAEIEKGLALIYSEAGIIKKAEEHYRNALSCEPENPQIMNSLATFLIENNRNVNEVPDLMDKAMALASNKYDYYEFSDTKGWGLYKLGRYREALDILQKTWDSTPFPMYFIYQHLQEVKKVVTGK